VKALYGPSIHKTVKETLHRLGAERIRVTVEDQGALPWVLEARVEAAFLHGGGTPAAGAHPGRRPDRLASSRPKDALRRSRLYLPGNEPKFMVNAGLHRPDGIILDLEDSVHPAEKRAARLLVRNALRWVDFGGAERMVRINQGEMGLEDLDMVVPEEPGMILIPKVEGAPRVVDVAERISSLRDREGSQGEVWLMPIVESALGVENAHAIASAHPSVAALTIGLEDLTADLGVVKTQEGEETRWARSRVVNAAKAAGVQAIDSVYGDVADEDGLLTWGIRSRAMGFEGMGCIHPRQIRIIHDAFAPTEAELQRALRIVEAFDEAQRKGLGVVSLGTKMVDRPVVLRARRLVDQARDAGLISAEPATIPEDA
jgi:citrate lyase subunit beta/citryl-CoA lyase